MGYNPNVHLDVSLYTILQILSLTLFEKTPFSQACVKFVSAVELIALLADRKWLDDATKTIGQFLEA